MFNICDDGWFYDNLAWARYPNIWSNTSLDVAVELFSEEMNLYIGRFE